MKVQNKYTIELTIEETSALERLLGVASDDWMAEQGMNQREVKAMTKLYNMLPEQAELGYE